MTETNIRALAGIADRLKDGVARWVKTGGLLETDHDVLRLMMRYLHPEELDLVWEYKATVSPSDFTSWMTNIYVGSGCFAICAEKEEGVS